MPLSLTPLISPSDVLAQNRALVAPSLLSADFANLGQALKDVEAAGADWIHLDVMDGRFVPNLTIGPPVIKALRPHSTLPFDVHLMIEEPERSIEDYAQAGANVITVHVEACRHLQRTLRQIRDLGCLAGVSYNPSTPLSGLEYILEDVDLLLIMSVNPGFGGQTFIESALQKLTEAKDRCQGRPILIEVDGGISTHNAATIRNAGAQVLVAGNAVFGAKTSMAEAIQGLR
jgi:ribulose-phosphate 3-epimerase